MSAMGDPEQGLLAQTSLFPALIFFFTMYHDVLLPRLYRRSNFRSLNLNTLNGTHFHPLFYWDRAVLKFLNKTTHLYPQLFIETFPFYLALRNNHIRGSFSMPPYILCTPNFMLLWPFCLYFPDKNCFVLKRFGITNLSFGLSTLFLKRSYRWMAMARCLFEF